MQDQDRLVVVAGHLCLDLIPSIGLSAQDFMGALQPGHLVEVGAMTMSTGGAVSNTGLALHRLGIPTRLIGKVGRDLLGEVVKQVIDSYGPGLSAGLVVSHQASTSYTVILNPPGLDRIFMHSPGANHAFTSGDIDLDLVSEAVLFHFGYPPIMRSMYVENGRELVEIFRRVKACGVTTSLDLAYPDPASEAGRADWRAILSAVLPDVDIFLPSIEEILFMLHRDTYKQLSRRGRTIDQVTPGLLHDLSSEILASGVRIVGIKLGERGLYLRTGSANSLSQLGRARPADIEAWASFEGWAPCFQVQVVGTTGAGDATIAGFLSALLRGLSPEEAVTAAVAVGACNVEAADALSGLKSWEETLVRVKSGWPRRPLSVQEPGWTWDSRAQIWRSV
jgi:sugar/nucleoside kinase (ribokinase family)